MRTLTPWLLATCLLTGCDPQVMALLSAPLETKGASPAPSKPGAGPGSRPAATASAQPVGERMTPIDLSNMTWVPEQPGTWEVAGDRISVPKRSGSAYLFYRPALGDTFTLRFREPREVVSGDLQIQWMLDRSDSPRKDAAGNTLPTANQAMLLKANGDVTVTLAGKAREVLKGANGPRQWEIAVTPSRTTIRLNDAVLTENEHVPGYHPSPFLAFTGSQVKVAGMAVEGVSVTSSAPGTRTTVLRQYDMTGRGVGVDRFNMLYASDRKELPSEAQMDTAPAILPHVVAQGGYLLTRLEALIFARTDDLRGGTHGGTGIFLHPAYFKAAPLLAHEMAHGYGQGGAQGARTQEGWLVEGLADYLCYAAYQRYLGRPEWRQPPMGKRSFDPPLSESHAETRARDGEKAVGYKVYGKGRIFFSVLAAYTSHDDVRAVIAGNRSLSKLTGEMFVKALETRTGQDLAFLRPGWLVAGPYAKVSPNDADDADKDGLLGYQELIWGSDPQKADTDADGADDFAERAAGTVATDASSKPAGLVGAGFAGSLIGGLGPEAEPEPTEHGETN